MSLFEERERKHQGQCCEKRRKKDRPSFLEVLPKGGKPRPGKGRAKPKQPRPEQGTKTSEKKGKRIDGETHFGCQVSPQQDHPDQDDHGGKGVSIQYRENRTTQRRGSFLVDHAHRDTTDAGRNHDQPSSRQRLRISRHERIGDHPCRSGERNQEGGHADPSEKS